MLVSIEMRLKNDHRYSITSNKSVSLILKILAEEEEHATWFSPAVKVESTDSTHSCVIAKFSTEL